jgi:pimeloyl-ACP methyl ester carboxylesterase
VLFLSAGLSACGSTDSLPPPTGGPPSQLARDCDDSLDWTYTKIPDYTNFRPGAPVKDHCARDTTIDAASIDQLLRGNGYTGPEAKTGVTVYRVAYFTRRLANNPNSNEGVSTALIFFPDKIPLGQEKVLVVTAHQAVGFGDQCAPSLASQTMIGDDTHTLNLAIAGAGWITIAPDYAGFFFNGTPQGWLLAEDEAHSLLDATQAMTELLEEENKPEKVVMVGHSQGGHAVLAAQALEQDYGIAGELAGVAAFAPFWMPPRTWGAALATGLTTETDPEAITFSLMYFYGHGELYDGPGGGLAMIQPESQADVSRLLTRYCLDEVRAGLPDLGLEPRDFFEPLFPSEVGACALAGNEASCGAGEAKLWNDRFQADRPKLDRTGAPIVVWQGRDDQVVTPDRAKCGFDRIRKDLAKAPESLFTVCGDDQGTHGSVLNRNIGWVNEWIAARAVGGDEPAACPGEEALVRSGVRLECTTPPPNDAD